MYIDSLKMDKRIGNRLEKNITFDIFIGIANSSSKTPIFLYSSI